LKALGATLGVLQQAPRAFLQAGSTLDDASIERRILERAEAKKNRDFALADNRLCDLRLDGIDGGVHRCDLLIDVFEFRGHLRKGSPGRRHALNLVGLGLLEHPRPNHSPEI